jgi:MFS family permease
LLAALLSAAILPSYGWRPLFALGAAPALLVAWIQRRVEEPEAWHRPKRGEFSTSALLFEVRGRILRASVLTACVLFAYWGLFTWLPAYLGASREMGGAGLSVMRTSAWMVPVQIGALLGYLSFGFLADRFGRRPVFVGFVLAAALLVPVYGAAARSASLLLILGPLIGFFGHGYFSLFGAMLAELFPARIRATAQGLCYNVGRAASALAPVAIGALADRWGIGTALAMTSAFFIASAMLISSLPETRAASLS